MSLADIVANYGIERYHFSQSFIESGDSSSGYQGLLSSSPFETEHVSIIQSFIEIFNNFMQVIYHSPS